MLQCGARRSDGVLCSLEYDHQSPLNLRLSYSGFSTLPTMNHANVDPVSGEILLWQNGEHLVTEPELRDSVEAIHGSPTAEDGRLGPPLEAINGGPSMPKELFDQLARRNELARWWRGRAEAEIGQTVDKAIEYGSHDLDLIGQEMAGTLGLDLEAIGITPAELGIAFYAFGKTARIMSAYRDGHAPSEDSWLDLGIYSRMAQRTRTHGGWPGGAK